MKPTIGSAVLATLAIAALVSCSSSPDSSSDEQQATTTPPTSSVTEPLATTTAPAPPTSVRGAIVKSFGDLSGLGCTTDATRECDIEFTIGAPATANNCSDEYLPENGGVPVALPVTVTTNAGIDASLFNEMWNPNNFSVVQANGVTLPDVATTATYGCDESERTIPSNLSPASMYEGFVVLDLPPDAQTLLYLPNQARAGWEYALGGQS